MKIIPEKEKAKANGRAEKEKKKQIKERERKKTHTDEMLIFLECLEMFILVNRKLPSISFIIKKCSDYHVTLKLNQA